MNQRLGPERKRRNSTRRECSDCILSRVVDDAWMNRVGSAQCGWIPTPQTDLTALLRICLPWPGPETSATSRCSVPEPTPWMPRYVILSWWFEYWREVESGPRSKIL